VIAGFVPENSPLFGQVESAFIDLNGKQTRTENFEPYASFGDSNGDFFGGSIPDGENTVEFKLYSEDNLGGQSLGTVIRNFTIVGEDAPTEPPVSDDIIGLGLYNARTNALIGLIEDGDEILKSTFDEQNINIAAIIRQDSDLFGKVESMFFDLNDGQITRIENFEPFALFGDSHGDFFSGSLSTGEKTLTIEAYAGNGKSGPLLAMETFNFTVIDNVV
jgi:hypothetical protein